MAIESSELTQLGGEKVKISRRGLLIGGGGAVLVGLAAKFGIDTVSSSPTPETSASPRFNIETFAFPPGYKHDLILPARPDLAAADGGPSALLPSELRIVTVCDAYKGQLTGPADRPGLVPGSEHMLHNVALLFDEEKQTVTRITGPNKFGNETSWITPKEQDGSYYWTQNPFVDRRDGTLYIPLIRNLPPELGGKVWTTVGTDIAVFPHGRVDTEPEIITLPRVNSWTRDSTVWGTAMIQEEDCTYITGSIVQKADNPDHKKEMHLARVPNGQLKHLDKWEFWNGTDWIGVDKNNTNDPLALENAWKAAELQATALIKNTEGLSTNYSVHRIDDKIVIISKEDDNMGSSVLAFVGSSLKDPKEPFKRHMIMDKDALASNIPPQSRRRTGSTSTYAAYLHPDKLNKKGQMLLTYSIGPDDEITNNVNTYGRVAVWIDKDTILGK